MDHDSAGTVFLIILIIGGLLVFFLPTIIAVHRSHPYRLAIFLVNLFGGPLGGIGWVAALVWSVLPFERPWGVRIVEPVQVIMPFGLRPELPPPIPEQHHAEERRLGLK